MKTVIFPLVLILSFPGALYAQVYSCTGPDGERYFSDTPCQKVSVIEQNLEEDLRRARIARIEELEVSITKTKRELMDTELAYLSSLSGRTTEELAILKGNFDEKMLRLNSQLKELQTRRADLVEQSFADHANSAR